MDAFTKSRTIILFFCVLCVIFSIHGQHPNYFNYTIDNGAPTNENYCIIQDEIGYIWIGSDAGVYRFNGVIFEHFSSNKLTGRSATGLTQSPNGRIFGYNFNNQIFFIENEKLHVIDKWDKPVNGLATDKDNNIWISSSEGVFKLDGKSLTSKEVFASTHVKINSKVYTSSIRNDASGTIYYRNYSNIIEWNMRKCKTFDLTEASTTFTMILSKSKTTPWLFDQLGNCLYKPNATSWVKHVNTNLNRVLEGRKITNVVETEDGNIWINTHSGLVLFNKYSEEVELLYNHLSFSDCLKDREGNYWFTTLHNGILRVPQFDIRLWSGQLNSFGNDQFSHIVSNGESILLGGANGLMSELNLKSNSLKIINHGPESDLGMMYFDTIDNCTYFNKINSIYKWKNGRIESVNDNGRPIKSMFHNKEGYFISSSQGLFFTKDIRFPLDDSAWLLKGWFREIIESPFNKDMIVASNKGVFIIGKNESGKWLKKNVCLSDKQILSVGADKVFKKIFVLTFDGMIYVFDEDFKVEKKISLEKEVRATQLKVRAGMIYLATNSGVLELNPLNSKVRTIDNFKGLSSKNVSGIIFQDDICWVATGKGVHKVPLKLFSEKFKPGIIVLKGVYVNGVSTDNSRTLKVNYNDQLTIKTDGISYRSNGEFEFAYRFVGENSDWIKVPASTGELSIPSLPTGNVTVEIKLVDHQGLYSKNVISIGLDVLPPFWQRWWFYVLITLTMGIIVYFIFKIRERRLKKRQEQELKNLHLSNELRLTQQNALKAQMNPHFLFNVLNSIKGYIYENDKKNAAKYLNEFSSLVRKILEMSTVATITLDQEIEVLKVYINLEAMLLEGDFTLELKIDDAIDTTFIKVPSLTIQPFIENAFKHGLRHQIGHKHLGLLFEHDEASEVLIVTIEDNGIGRVAANKINDVSRGEHQSFAGKAMQHRLELLNYNKKDLVGIEIRDNVHENKTVLGTTVIIRIHV